MLYQAILAVNGLEYPISVEAQRSLLSVLRNELGLTGSKEGCDDSECGACMVLIDGQARELVQLPRAAGERSRDHDGRGALRWRRAASAAARLPERRRRAVRVLHARAC